MAPEIISALIALCGTAVGTFGGILASSRLTSYRLEQLENKVNKHNNLVERMYGLEGRIEVIENRIKVNGHRIEDLENYERER